MDKIKINVHDMPSNTEIKIEVFGNDNIGKLNDVLNIQDSHQLIFNGIILSRAFSFLFYGIKNEDHLYIYHQNKNMIQEKNPTGELSKLAKKRKSIQNVLLDERLRIKDILYRRIEGNHHSHQKLIKAFVQFTERPEEQKTSTTTISDISATSPSTTNLPLLWESRSTGN